MDLAVWAVLKYETTLPPHTIWSSTDIEPGGPVASTRQMCRGDVFVSVDPGKEFLKVHSGRPMHRWLEEGGSGCGREEERACVVVFIVYQIWHDILQRHVFYEKAIAIAAMLCGRVMVFM